MNYDNIKYENVTSDVYQIMGKILNQHFPELLQNNIRIKCFFMTQMKMKNNKVLLAQISKANDRVKLLTHDQINQGYYDYVMDIDKKAWQIADEQDKVRIIRHELRHVELRLKNDGSISCALKSHDIEDFKIEIQLNEDKIDWGEKLAFIVESKYLAEKQASKKQ